MSLVDDINARNTPFTSLIGVTYTDATPDHLEATMLIREDMCTANSRAHGGALMSFADSMGAIATAIFLPDGFRTTTMESNTKFLRAAPVGDVLKGVCTPVHKGRTTQVWRTEIFREDGKLVAVVTQTQMVLAS